MVITDGDASFIQFLLNKIKKFTDGEIANLKATYQLTAFSEYSYQAIDKIKDIINNEIKERNIGK